MVVKSASKRAVTETQSGFRYIVKLSVTNGLFKTKAAADKARKAIAGKNKAIKTSLPVKVGSGYAFTSTMYYGARTAVAKTALVTKLNQARAKSGIPAKAVSITSRTV